MEFLLLLSFLLFLVVLVSIFLKKQKPQPAAGNHPSDEQIQLLPPGRTGLPLIGETLDYFSKLRNGVLWTFAAERMKKHSTKVFRTSLMGQPTAILCGPEGNRFVFSNEKKLVQVWLPSYFDKIFPKVDNTASGVASPNTEQTKLIRKHLPAVLKLENLIHYIGMMDTVMKQQLHTEWNREIIKLVPTISKFTLRLACRFFLGIEDPKKVDELAIPITDVDKGIMSIPINLPGTNFYRSIKASKVMRDKIQLTVRQAKIDLREKREPERPSLLTHMLLTADENGQLFNELFITNHVYGMLIGGYGSVTSSLTFIMKYLSELPHVYDEVLKEQLEIAKSKEQNEVLNWEDVRRMKYSWNVAREALRLMPLISAAYREVTTDFTYAGYRIPKGWKLHWMAKATHENPDYFPNPKHFDPSRFEGTGPQPFTFVPFGGGPRMCPGNEYARIVILVFMHNVVTKFRWEKLLPNEKVVHTAVPTMAHGLPVRLHPHKQ
ncbi:hypothetical protein RJ640_007436 [Escallonia rubra]|uniref:Cytochrome P450 n=1 Tax=Escallonia rubra TaxID=112253 RepID=A0AA88U2A8_9ASTE|nr:hypothetical protein RJ640_007429 [Escallonia rubra]KAK2990766.1 hypothetical protein RJ640_007436 [Escallonia rubra]